MVPGKNFREDHRGRGQNGLKYLSSRARRDLEHPNMIRLEYVIHIVL